MARKRSSSDASPEQSPVTQAPAKKKRRRSSSGKGPATPASAALPMPDATRSTESGQAPSAAAGPAKPRRNSRPGRRRGGRQDRGGEAERLRKAGPAAPKADFDEFEDAEPTGGRPSGFGVDDEYDEEAGWGAVLNPTTVLRLFREAGKPLSRKDILKAAGLPKTDKRQLYDVLGELLDQGRLIKIKGAYGLTESMRLVTGVFSVQRSGVGFLLPDDKNRQDILIRPGNFGDAWHGDRVAVAVQPTRTGRRAEGRIARVVERMTKELTVRVVKRLGGNLFLCLPTDPKLQMHFMIDADHAERVAGEEIKAGDVLDVTPEEKLERELWSAKARKLYGQESDLGVQETLVKVNHSIPTVFPEDVLAEAARLPELPSEEDFRDRRDLRDMGFVTIDGAKARDFDDAVLVEKDGRGYRLFVAIADVSHYVRQGSALDREASERANSYYFPQSVEPMFPERLSNGLCSLNPHVPRLAMVVETRFTAKGEPRDSQFYPAVIESKFRLTYSQVNRAVILKDEAERQIVAPVLPMLELAEKLARQIKARRTDRGSLDFDLPEPEILFNLQGETVDIRPKARNFAHQIVEEFMIAANEAVARHLTELELPCLYRVHGEPSPEKLETLHNLLSKSPIGARMPEPGQTMTPKDMQGLLQAAEGTDMEFLVNRLMLRTMMQAKYSPENEGHFGLASDCYGHFTSPIRRYADLVVHRSLRQALTGVPVKAGRMKELRQLAEHLSMQERKGIDAEREILKRITVLFLQDKQGETFNGVISSITDFGFWVDLKEVMADGLVRLSSITDDYYTFIPERMELLGQRTGRRFRLGQSLVVELTEVNLGRLEVTLSLAPEGALPTAKSAETRPVQAVNGLEVKAGKKRRPPKDAPTPEPALEIMNLDDEQPVVEAEDLAEAVQREARQEAQAAKSRRRARNEAAAKAAAQARAEREAAWRADVETELEPTAPAGVEKPEPAVEAVAEPSTPAPKPKRSRRKTETSEAPETTEAGAEAQPPGIQAETAESAVTAPAGRKRPSRKAKETEPAIESSPEASEPQTSETETAAPRRAKASPAGQTGQTAQPAEAAPAKPKRSRAKKAQSDEETSAAEAPHAAKAAEAADAAPPVSAEPGAEAQAKPKRSRKAGTGQAKAPAKTREKAESAAGPDAVKPAPAKKPARSRAKKASDGKPEE